MDGPGKTLRNIAIVVLLAVAIWQLPGGGTGANTISNLLSVLLLGGLTFFGYRMYMEHRVTLFDLPDRMRGILYASFGLLLFAFVATSRLWGEGGVLILVWFALIGAAGYGMYAVFRWSREY